MTAERGTVDALAAPCPSVRHAVAGQHDVSRDWTRSRRLKLHRCGQARTGSDAVSPGGHPASQASQLVKQQRSVRPQGQLRWRWVEAVIVLAGLWVRQVCKITR